MPPHTPQPPPSAPDSSSLTVVSNRLPFRAEGQPSGLELKRSSGGLVAALEPVLIERGGTWVGWAGIAREEIEGAGGLPLPDHGAVHYHEVPLSANEVAQFYGGFANRTLWPLFHYFIGRTVIDGKTWRVYERVNARFAQAAAAAAAEDGLVWIHDYQLLRVPHHLRRLRPGCRMAFFLHIPFPAADVLRVLPWSRSLLRGMLAADLVGFHVPSYSEHFLICAERLLGCEVDRAAGIVRFEGRDVSVQAHPISIDTSHLETLARRKPDKPQPAWTEGVRGILGVDRLDYTKGVHERLLAIERLLDVHPGYRSRIQFTQLLVPSRERVEEYSQMKKAIDETVGRINGRFSEPGWSPISYLVRSLPPEQLVHLYRQADVALVTPLRDGMNLVAKEYVASQIDNDGVLILSEMAGAAEELQEALIVNPFDIESVADALHRALSMTDDERLARMAALRDRVRANDVHAWVRRFLRAAEAASLHAAQAKVSPVDHARRRLARWLAERPTVVVFLDFDGTLTPIVARPEAVQVSEAARVVLEQAARTPNLDTVIVSGRTLADIQQQIGVPGLTYVGDHGFEIEGPGINYRNDEADRYRQACAAAADDLDKLGMDGAWVERKGATVAYHIRNVDPGRQAEAARLAEMAFKRRRLRVVTGKAIVEGRPPVEWHKGYSVLYVLTRRHGADWPTRVRALYLGDDTTDEDAFRSLHGIGRSVLVARDAPPGGTAADLRLPDPEAVVQLLRWLASGAFAAAPK